MSISDFLALERNLEVNKTYTHENVPQSLSMLKMSVTGMYSQIFHLQ